MLQPEDHQFRTQMLTMMQKGEMYGADVAMLMNLPNPASRPQLETPSTKTLPEKEVKAIEAGTISEGEAQ